MIKTILWDFDGVILDSMPVREIGFRETLKEYNLDIVERLISYHNQNGGLSRYVKFKYLFEELLHQNYTEDDIQLLATRFSQIMKEKLVNPNLLIQDSMNFIRLNHQKYNFHIVSGSDGNELNFLCQELGINHFFKSISGSPTPKIQLVEDVLNSNKYSKSEVVLIGDSHNDYEAANVNEIAFYGYNNESLESIPKTSYIHTFNSVDL